MFLRDCCVLAAPQELKKKEKKLEEKNIHNATLLLIFNMFFSSGVCSDLNPKGFRAIQTSFHARTHAQSVNQWE